MRKQTITVGITGASGSILAKLLLQELMTRQLEIHLVATNNAKNVFAYETGQSWSAFVQQLEGNQAEIYHHDSDNLFAPIASGSYPNDGMIIVPCSMSTAANIAHGTGSNLLCRAADVCIKEKRRLVISPRETPLSQIHLENLLTLSRNGAMIVPPIPPFYDGSTQYPAVLQAMVGRILTAAGFDNNLMKVWTEPQ